MALPIGVGVGGSSGSRLAAVGDGVPRADKGLSEAAGEVEGRYEWSW